MIINSRSRKAELGEGATDGKYRKTRIDSALSPMNAEGGETIARNRESLNMLDGYGGAETFDKVNPGGETRAR